MHCNFGPSCLTAFEFFRTEFTCKCIMAIDCTGVSFKLESHVCLSCKKGYCGVWTMFAWKYRYWLKWRPWDLRNKRDGLNTVFWLLWRPRRPLNGRVWSLSQIETFVEMSVSSKILDDYKKLISSISTENCDIFVIKQYQLLNSSWKPLHGLKKLFFLNRANLQKDTWEKNQMSCFIILTKVFCYKHLDKA